VSIPRTLYACVCVSIVDCMCVYAFLALCTRHILTTHTLSHTHIHSWEKITMLCVKTRKIRNRTRYARNFADWLALAKELDRLEVGSGV
jgi:hypothetical protein